MAVSIGRYVRGMEATLTDRAARRAAASYRLMVRAKRFARFDLPESLMSPLASEDRAAVRSQFAADPEYRDLLEMFAEALPERRRSLTDAFRAGKVSDLQTLAHQLKGAGGGFGFPGLTDHAAHLETVCREGATDRIVAALDRMLTYMDRITV